MTKRLTAYFSDSLSAQDTAFDISQIAGEGSEIVLSSESSSKEHPFDCCNLSAFFGAACGAIAGIGLSALDNGRLLQTISPLAGLMSGAVIGAITGSAADLINYEKLPECVKLTISLPDKSAAFLARHLRKRGARVINLHKGDVKRGCKKAM